MQNEPQLSAVEEMAIKYNIPLADLESLLATALEEQKKTYEEQIKELSYKTGIIEVYARFDDLTKQRVVTQDVLAILKGSE